MLYPFVCKTNITSQMFVAVIFIVCAASLLVDNVCVCGWCTCNSRASGSLDRIIYPIHGSKFVRMLLTILYFNLVFKVQILFKCFSCNIFRLDLHFNVQNTKTCLNRRAGFLFFKKKKVQCLEKFFMKQLYLIFTITILVIICYTKFSYHIWYLFA